MFHDIIEHDKIKGPHVVQRKVGNVALGKANIQIPKTIITKEILGKVDPSGHEFDALKGSQWNFQIISIGIYDESEHSSGSRSEIENGPMRGEDMVL